MDVKYYFVHDTSGVAVVGASVTIYTTGTLTKASIYSDNGVTTKINPLTTDSSGMVYFYIADGYYDIVVSGSGLTTRTLTNVHFSSASISGNTINVRADDPDTTGWGIANAPYTWFNTTEKRTKQWNGEEIVLL